MTQTNSEFINKERKDESDEGSSKALSGAVAFRPNCTIMIN